MAPTLSTGEKKMGETYVRMKVYGPLGSEELGDVLVDTGATLTKIPGSYAERLGIVPEQEIEVILGDGRRAKRQIGYARIEIEGFEELSRMVPIAFSDADQIHLLGVTALEVMALKVNPLEKKLERSRYIEY